MPIALASLILASAAWSAPSEAPPPSAEPGAIVVQGQRVGEKQVRDFIRELTPAAPRGQLGRFESPVCPAVAGLAAEQNQQVRDRLRLIAGAAGMEVAKAKCRPNVVVIVTGDKWELARQLAGKRSGYFPAGPSGPIYRALKDPAMPVVAWQIQQVRGTDGRLLFQATDSGEVGMDGVIVQRRSGTATRLTPMARQEFAGSVVIVQAGAIDGLTTTQLADYAAMRAFVRTDPSKLGPAASNSILNIITTPMGAPVPLTLTSWDLSFLKAYYASRLNNFAANQRSEMRELMQRDLEGQEESTE